MSAEAHALASAAGMLQKAAGHLSSLAGAERAMVGVLPEARDARNAGAASATVPRVVLASDDPAVAALASILLAATSTTSTATFTATTSGTAVNCTAAPMKHFSLACTATGAVTLFTVVLEASLDGTTYTTVLTGTQADAAGLLRSTGSSPVPARYWRLRCSILTLGAGTNVVAVGLGMP